MNFTPGEEVEIELRAHTRHGRNGQYTEKPPHWGIGKFVSQSGNRAKVEVKTLVGVEVRSFPLSKLRKK